MESHLRGEDLLAAAGRDGYLHPGYAEAFVEVGEVRHLRRSGTWMLSLGIDGSDRRDALIGYPLLICRDWVGLAVDLAETAALADVVSISAVTDPLATVDEEVLRPAFGDLVRVEALHHIVDLATSWPSREHRRAVRQVLQLVDVEVEDAPSDVGAIWAALHGSPLPGAELGLSSPALEGQLQLPGCVAFTVQAEDGPVAAAVVYVTGDHAYLHALAADREGERLGAPYALVQTILEDMAGRGLRSLDLGAARDDAAFMAGWTEQTRPAYRCGRIVDRVAYEELAAATETTGGACFPVYRDPAARLNA
jgi:ribosomal protein S18 acetylase RimI-like enzyme